MSLAEIAYRESVRSIESQEASIAELRSRTVVVFAAAALSISLLGSVAFSDGWGAAEWVGVALLAFMVVALAVIAWPRPWKFRVSGHEIVTEWVDAQDDSTIDDLYRDLAIHLTDALLANQMKANQLSRVYAGAIALALGSIIAFASALI